jgi:hypothetical protein
VLPDFQHVQVARDAECRAEIIKRHLERVFAVALQQKEIFYAIRV